MSTHDVPDTSDADPQHPKALLTGLFLGFASIILTFGVLWPFAPLFPAVVALLAAAIPITGHWHVATGAFYAVLGVAAGEIIFIAILLLYAIS